MPGINIFSFILVIFLIVPISARGELSVQDDLGRKITLAHPAERIISLAPNLTELLYSAGAGGKLIATVRFSDYPPQAMELPRIGDAHNVDMEAIIALKPDLIVSWRTGTAAGISEKLSALGFTVYQAEPDTLEKIAHTIEHFGHLAGTETAAMQSSQTFLDEIQTLDDRYSKKDKVRVFYQFWDRPMYTVNGQHLITRFIELCGGENIYSGLESLTPIVDVESVLVANPGVIIASGNDENRPDWLDNWKAWPELGAVAHDHLYSISPDLVQRHSVRVIQGIRSLCSYIDRAR
jgi:iron complex transport system substrate-binding protein